MMNRYPVSEEHFNAYEFDGDIYALTEAGKHALLEAIDTAIQEDWDTAVTHEFTDTELHEMVWGNTVHDGDYDDNITAIEQGSAGLTYSEIRVYRVMLTAEEYGSAVGAEPLDYTDAWVCVDCLFYCEYPCENPAAPDEPEFYGQTFMGQITGRAHSNSGNDNGFGTRDFDTADCDGCGSRLAGSRHLLSVHK